jgi:hypothetical protein
MASGLEGKKVSRESITAFNQSITATNIRKPPEIVTTTQFFILSFYVAKVPKCLPRHLSVHRELLSTERE